MPGTPTSAALNPPATATEVFDVLFRPLTGGKWRKVGRATGYRAALELTSGSGDWWYRRAKLRAEAQAETGSTLFDDIDDERPEDPQREVA